MDDSTLTILINKKSGSDGIRTNDNKDQLGCLHVIRVKSGAELEPYLQIPI